MLPLHNSSWEVELEFCKRIICNGLKQAKWHGFYTVTCPVCFHFVRSGPKQFLTAGTLLRIVGIVYIYRTALTELGRSNERFIHV